MFTILEQRNELLQISKTSQVDATRRALDMIDQLPHPNKYTNLLDVLKEAGWFILASVYIHLHPTRTKKKKSINFANSA